LTRSFGSQGEWETKKTRKLRRCLARRNFDFEIQVFFFFAKPDFNIVSEMFGSPDSDPDIQNRVPKKHDLHF